MPLGRVRLLDSWIGVFVFGAPPRLGPGVRLPLNAVFCLFFSDFCPGPHLPLWRAPLLDSWVARRLPSPRVCLLYPRGRLPLPAVTCLVFSDFLSGPTLAFIWCAPSGRLCRDGCFCVSTQWDTFLCSLCFSGPLFRPWALSEFWADSSGGERPRSPSTSCSFLDSSGVFWASVGSWAFAFVPPSFGFPVGPSFWLL